jgi:hypothetical protein
MHAYIAFTFTLEIMNSPGRYACSTTLQILVSNDFETFLQGGQRIRIIHL